MTVKELRDRLDAFVKYGQGDLNVIANCEFTITKGNGHYSDKPLIYLNDVYYQSGDIELAFSDEEE